MLPSRYGAVLAGAALLWAAPRPFAAAAPALTDAYYDSLPDAAVPAYAEAAATGPSPLARDSARPEPVPAPSVARPDPVSAAPGIPELPEAYAHARRPFTAASSQTLRDRDFALRVMLKPSDLLKVTPGLFTGQHAGGGKANQYFLRGFDIDHGTDLALWVDGMPVNNVSHGHGQGYADLHFIIPELFERVEVNKGPYFAEYGDFATAGAVRMRTRERFTESSAELSMGVFNTYRFLGIWAAADTALNPVLAAEVYRDDGPFENPEDLSRYKLFFRSGLARTATSSLELTLMAYGSDWNGSGQIPLREVEAGRLDRFGSVDPTEGGNSRRQSAQLTLTSRPDDRGELIATAYAINYRLDMFSDFTFFAGDPVRGDQIEQEDGRLVTGFNAVYRTERRALDRDWTTTVGLDLRNDRIENALGRSVKRRKYAEIAEAEVHETSLGIHAQEEVSPLPWARLVAGLRADYFGFDVTDNLLVLSDSAPKTSGTRSAAIFSPKANLILGPFLKTELYLNYGQGFHSNDARGVVKDPDGVTPLAKAEGYEIGVRNALIPRVDLAASAWRLDLESELVWVGDEGVTEARGATERLGVDAEIRVRLFDWLWADADVTLSDATYTNNAGNGDAVALAPTAAFAGGLSARHPSGLKGSLRAQSLADRPANEDGSLTAEGFAVVDLGLGYRWRNLEADLSIANLFDVEWREAQFANESRLPSEPEPVEDIHFVPGTPFQVQCGIRVFF